jgi:hypothetical protein
LQSAGCTVVSVEESAHFGGCRVCKGGSVDAVGLSPVKQIQTDVATMTDLVP